MQEKEYLRKVIEQSSVDKERVRYRALNSVKSNRSSVMFNKSKGGFRVKKSIMITAIAVFAIVLGLVTAANIYTPVDNTGVKPLSASNYEQIFGVIENYYEMQNRFSFDGLNFGLKSSLRGNDEAVLDSAPPSPESYSAGGTDDYSETNVQHEGIDEGDIVKNDGQYIYKINSKGCVIVEAINGNMQIISSIDVDNYIPQELYINGDRLIMIGGIYEYVSYTSGATSIMPLRDYMYYMRYSKTDIRIYDISDRSEPQLERRLTIDGSYHTSRLTIEDSKLFYMVNYHFYYGNQDNYIPQIEDNLVNDGARMKISADNIYYYPDIVSYSYMIIGQIDLEAPEDEGLQAAFLGLSGEIYVSPTNIFVATYDYYSRRETNVFGWVKDNYQTIPQTRIVKIGLADLEQKASTRVDGTIKDRYSMDEYNGYLRLATTVFSSKMYNKVYVLKPDLTVAGVINDIAEGERIYSVRFNGTTGSLVTFEMIDPYFNLDLSNPYDPKISKGLKEDGVSHYIHYLGDTSYTIGVGQESRVVTNHWGEFVQWIGLKVSLYDNSSGEAVNVNTIVIEGSCHSELFYNPKALLYDYSRGLFAFSYENWQYDNYYYYSSMQQGLAVFEFNLDAEDDKDKLIYRDTLSNIQGGLLSNDWYNYYNGYLQFINRGIRIGDYIYTISDKYITSYDIESLDLIAKLDLY